MNNFKQLCGQILETRIGDAFHPRMTSKSWCPLLHHSQVQLLAALVLASENSLLQDNESVHGKSPLTYYQWTM